MSWRRGGTQSRGDRGGWGQRGKGRGGLDGSRGTKPCRQWQTSLTCSFGDGCSFLHDEQSHSATPKRVGKSYKREQTVEEEMEYMEYDSWKRQLKLPPSSENIKTIRAIWSGALNFLDGQTRNLGQMVARDLEDDKYYGREHMQALLSLQNDSPVGTLVDLGSVFLRVFTHPALLSCLSIDTYVGALYTFISGNNGIRVVTFCDRFVKHLAQHPSVFDDSPQMLETNLILVLHALREVLSRETRARYNEHLPALLDLIERTRDIVPTSAHSAADQITRDTIAQMRAMINRATDLLSPEDSQGIDDRMAGIQTSTFPRELVIPQDRHDNDKMDITKIVIIPTEDETRSDHKEFLPSTNPTQTHFLTDPISRHLDTHFRLLRHDIFWGFKEAIGRLMHTIEEKPEVLKSTKLNLGNKIRARLYADARVNNTWCEDKRDFEAKLSFHQPAVIQKKDAKEREVWWSNTKALDQGVLLCLIFLESGRASLLLLTVSDRCTNPKINFSLTSDSRRATVSVRLVAPIQRNVESLIRLHLQSTQCMLVELPGILLATFQPILQSIQDMQRMGRLPFHQWILPAGSSEFDIPPPLYARGASSTFSLKPILQDEESEDLLVDSMRSRHDPNIIHSIARRTGLDVGQSRALIEALSREYALIQGPPGTGKSYLGVQIMRVLLAQKRSADLGPIIVVCYTNHALDQFLEHLIDVGIEKVIRIGSQSHSEALMGKNLRLVSREEGKTRSEGQTLGKTYADLDQERQNIRYALAEIHKMRKRPDWASLQTYLRTRHHRVFSQYSAKDRKGFEVVGKNRFEVWLSSRDHPQHGVTTNSTGTQLATDEQLLDMATCDIFSVPVSQRSRLVGLWTEALFSERVDSLFESVKRCERLNQELTKVHDEVDRRVLQTADVIGVTTSGLAKRIAVLQKIHSKVTICEEAGEVLEAHTLSALLPSVQHFIQIGDHEQLRPQINEYSLSLESSTGRNYQLDRSQFERLAATGNGTAKFPVAQLNIQRRMRPEISTLIRETIYPNLVDHDSTKDLKSIVGMRKNVFWLDHDNAEEGASPDVLQKSHANLWEVDMVHAFIRHIVRQGTYKSSEIAVLTPYTGQLQRLRAKLRDDFEIILNERDEDLLEGGAADNAVASDEQEIVAPPHASGSKTLEKKRLSELLRLATVDNFQGEEAKIVIVSLVRSNKEQKVGFLKTTNRINVLLSRAQEGMYLIGNAETYSKIDMWARVIGMLRATDSVGTRLSLCCPRHQDTDIQVSQPDDFPRVSPEGGCRLACDRRLEGCGHQCQARCHSDFMHRAFACQQPCPRLHTPCGHVCQKPTCGEDCGRCMIKKNDSVLPCGHTKDNIPCYQTQNLSKVACTAIVAKEIPGCNHIVDIACLVSISEISFKCPHPCSSLLSCGHRCPGTCGQCKPEEIENEWVTKHKPCNRQCGRKYATCNHLCRKRCHSGEGCGSCTAQCEVRCAHSRCTLSCSKACAPCIELCIWACEHQGSCTLPCAAPCDRLPCDQRCSLSLPCGHRCPGLCGEDCPDEYCQVCSTRQSARVDMLEMKEYSDIDLDEDPIVVLGCGHFFTAETLDGITGIAEVYKQNALGEFTGLRDISTTLAPAISCCPDCKRPIQQHVSRRFNRAINRAVMDEMSKRFLVSGQMQLIKIEAEIADLERTLEDTRQGLVLEMRQIQVSLVRSSDKSVSSINARLKIRSENARKLEKRIQSFRKEVTEEFQPARKLHDAMHARHQSSLQASMERLDLSASVPPISRDRRITRGGFAAQLKTEHLILADKFTLVQELATKSFRNEIKIAGGAIDLSARPFFKQCAAFIDECMTDNLPKLAVEACIYYADIARLYQSQIPRAVVQPGSATTSAVQYFDKAKELLEKAEELCAHQFQDVKPLLAVVQQLAELFKGDRYEQITSEEIAAIKAALVSGPRGIASHSGHWYNCENGHPFAVGECGMPMEQARCPECGAQVGGQNHRPAPGVTRATQME